MKKCTQTGWAVKWRSKNRLDGKREHFSGDWKLDKPTQFSAYHPCFFKTREAARAWVRERYGYIAKRRDLWREPHGWKMPLIVRAKVEMKELR